MCLPDDIDESEEEAKEVPAYHRERRGDNETIVSRQAGREVKTVVRAGRPPPNLMRGDRAPSGLSLC